MSPSMTLPSPDLRGIWGFPLSSFDGPRIDLGAYETLVARRLDLA
jgi:hypothetical protein